MDTSPNPNPNPNPSPSPKSNIYHIGGIPVDFPYKPYGSQLAFMSRVISTLDRARRQGHCNALLESPTGTGKTLSLLCSSLAWQQQQSLRLLSNPLSEVSDPLIHGGGFVPDPDPSGNSEMVQQAGKGKRKGKVPTIYYASRTHSQISQVIREYKKTSYRMPMAVLASWKHYCTNKHVHGKENVDEVCKLLLKDPSGGCLEFKNANKVKSHPSFQIGGCFEVYDIEDMVRVGQRVKGCSYFAVQTLAAEAQLVFCPYSYIINPIVRRAMDVDIKGCIVILDEAHNIEDMAREGGSVDVEEDVLHALQAELGQLCMNDNLAMTYRPLYDVIEGIIGWINIRKDNLQKCEFELYLSSKSLSSYCFVLVGNLISWRSTFQHVVALSTTESEFMAATECVKEALWLQWLLRELRVESRPTLIKSDSQSALHLMKNPTHHDRSKHIHVRMHFIREIVNQGDVIVEKVNSKVNPADLFTKPLARARMDELLDILKFEDLT